MATKLGLYNESLRLLGERRLSTVTDDRSSRRHLDDAYTDALAYCLEQGYWNFAMRSAQLDASDSVEPTFGYQFAFTKPDDWVRTFLLATNEFFNPALLYYNDEGGYWYTDTDPIWIRYVSNDTAYGADLALWPATYGHYVSCRLAVMSCPSIRTDSDTVMQRLYALEKRARIDARSKDAMNEPPLFGPQGSWTQARRGYGSSNKPRSTTLGY